MFMQNTCILNANVLQWQSVAQPSLYIVNLLLQVAKCKGEGSPNPLHNTVEVSAKVVVHVIIVVVT